MFTFRRTRRRIREARYLGQPIHPVRWALEAAADDLRWFVQVLGDLGQVLGGRS